ncbi:phage integrase family protein [Rhodobacter viridis]|uniref:Phage integrase family protein n=1 Tax=Rhodobacter viridis TaxID=1054202 RepID=A0A318TW26_9RHOB|nr:tyrosine-type recombinase/integrase [Rhodobacter viridis]PYF08070.1 phage integrase family protein [Rhodobacter viridis]
MPIPKPPKVVLRGASYYLRRRVPGRYKDIEPRTDILMSLHTDSQAEAQRKAIAIWDDLLRAWEARLAGNSKEADQRYAAAVEIAQRYGHRYLPVEDVAALPLEKIAERISRIPQIRGEPDAVVAAALLGTVAKPKLTLSKALDDFWGIAADRVIGKTEDDIRRWRNPRIKAVKNFIALVGDRDLGEINTDDMQTFRRWWIDRIRDEDLTANSAKKDIGHLMDVLRTVNDAKQLGLPLAFGRLSIADTTLRKERPPFSREWITKTLLAPGALDGLNPEARAIFLTCINTGCRPSEIADLLSEHIRLDAKIPHIHIHKGKTRNAIRDIPLLGVSLEAIRQFPNGFARYRDNPTLSATTNKFLRENGLMESDEHTAYSLRHSFETRMIAAGIEERVKADLMGHAIKRERYGVTPLETLRDAVVKIAM